MTTTTDILNRASELFLVSPEVITGHSRMRRIVRVRHAVCLALRRRGWSMPKIAKVLNYRDHSPVFYGIIKAEENEVRDERYRKRVAALVAFHTAPLEEPTPPEPVLNEWGMEVAS